MTEQTKKTSTDSAKPSVFCHALGICESKQVGAGTRVWAFAHVMERARLGKDCNVGEHCYVENGAIVGDRCVIKNGVAVWDGVTLEDDVFVGPYAVFTNDLLPRAKKPAPSVPTLVQKGATIGANATIVCGNTIGRYAFIAAGAVVTRDVPEHALMMGTPAKEKGFVCRCARKLKFNKKDHAKCECGLRFHKKKGAVKWVE